jgi:carboxypeptidase C (cathepsin A)
MARFLKVGATFALGVASVSAGTSAADDLITSLPGAENLDLPNMYSGYLDATDEKHMFYWLVEAAENPETAPVALWTNGGPGCSGFIGLMTEQGPFRPMADGTLVSNPASWHYAANILFIEQPVGVGFSYSDNTADYVTGDAQAAEDLYNGILAFYNKFTNLKGNDFYMTAESYGGHYLPSTTKYILDQGTADELNFKGYFLGNPWTDVKANSYGRIQTLYGHGLVPKVDYDAWLLVCVPGEVQYAPCAKATAKILSESKWDGQNIDALDYPSCNSVSSLSESVSERIWLRERGMGLNPSKAYNSDDDNTPDLPYDPCVDNYGTTYLNRADVQEAIHVNATVRNKTTILWSECTFKLDYNQADQLESMIPVYQEILNNEYPLKLEIYSGDDDSNCPMLGTLEWTYGLELEETSSWSPWYCQDAPYGNQFAGFQVSWAAGNSSTLTLSTVHGAGHEVPTYKGQQALQLFQRYLERN